MFPPRFFTQGKGDERDRFKDKVGGEVEMDHLTEEAALHVLKAEDTPMKWLRQDPPSSVRLYPGQMHFVCNHGTQIKFASEVLLDGETAACAAYHAMYGSPYFSEVSPEDYTNMYVKIESAIKQRIAGGTPKSDWLSC